MQVVACTKKKARKSDEVDVKLVSSLSMAAVLLRCRNPCLSALACHLFCYGMDGLQKRLIIVVQAHYLLKIRNSIYFIANC